MPDSDEVLDGVKTSKYISYDKDSTNPISYVYVVMETGIRMKTVTLDKEGNAVLSVISKNIKVGPPDESIFDLPDKM